MYGAVQDADTRLGDLHVTPEWLGVASELAASTADEPGLLRPLPCGRHGLPREFVWAHQRTRLLEAVVAVAGSEGYGALTNYAIAHTAGVSTSALHRHFASHAECLLAACDASLDWLLQGLERAVAAEPDWVVGTERGLRALIERVTAEPQLARVWLVELYAVEDVDVGGAQRRGEALWRIAAALRPPEASPGDVREQVLAGGIWRALSDAIIQGRAATLTELLPALHYQVLVAQLDPEEAALAAGYTAAVAL